MFSSRLSVVSIQFQLLSLYAPEIAITLLRVGTPPTESEHAISSATPLFCTKSAEAIEKKEDSITSLGKECVRI